MVERALVCLPAERKLAARPIRGTAAMAGQTRARAESICMPGVPRHIHARRSRHILLAVDGTAFAAVQAASMAGKGDPVNRWLVTLILPLAYGRGSA